MFFDTDPLYCSKCHRRLADTELACRDCFGVSSTPRRSAGKSPQPERLFATDIPPITLGFVEKNDDRS